MPRYQMLLGDEDGDWELTPGYGNLGKSGFNEDKVWLEWVQENVWGKGDRIMTPFWRVFLNKWE